MVRESTSMLWQKSTYQIKHSPHRDCGDLSSGRTRWNPLDSIPNRSSHRDILPKVPIYVLEISTTCPSLLDSSTSTVYGVGFSFMPEPAL